MTALQTDTLVDQYFHEIEDSVGLSAEDEVQIAKKIKDSYIFPSEQYRYDRYAEFLNLKEEKYIKIMKGIFYAPAK